MSASADVETSPLAIVCGSGTLPYAVADAVQRRGRRVVLFAVRGWASEKDVTRYAHHWIGLADFGRFIRLSRAENCRDIVVIGAMLRPALWQLRPDWQTIRLFPRLFQLWRGGDNHLLSGLVRIVEERGYHCLGPHEVAPEILMAAGVAGRQRPSVRDLADTKLGLSLLSATAAYDIGQAVVVSDQRVIAIEAAEGTDRMLERVANMRRDGRISLSSRAGVLVKAPKVGQELRVDMPSIGPHTVERAAAAGLAGIAVVASSTIAAEPAHMIELADRAGIFVAGVSGDGSLP